jgi:trehalose/maltose hydrolase-like predicted phosphorylase
VAHVPARQHIGVRVVVDRLVVLVRPDPALLQPKPMPADLLLGREVTRASKVIKQADVVMLCHVLSNEIPANVTRANYEYYEPFTVHGSSLSPAVHAAVAAGLGLTEQAMWQFRLACAVDLADNMGNAASGLHMATMGPWCAPSAGRPAGSGSGR